MGVICKVLLPWFMYGFVGEMMEEDRTKQSRVDHEVARGMAGVALKGQTWESMNPIEVHFLAAEGRGTA